MKHQKETKKKLTPRKKDHTGDTIYHGKPVNNKVKYNHKNHWLDEELEEMAPYKMKKKKKTE